MFRGVLDKNSKGKENLLLDAKNILWAGWFDFGSISGRIARKPL
jgi:hypothetical protein